ncbi:MAG: hypothetical protein KGJ55_02820 [Gammaproteobacteria bacterium]|nr:hypothetical protein [Gammaproteobacteria bacterium]
MKSIHAALLGAGLLTVSATAAAAPTCHGKLASLQVYAGGYDGRKLLAEPAVAVPLTKLLGPALRQLQKTLDVAGPVDLVGCNLVVAGNAQMKGGEEDAIVDINLYSGAVAAGIQSGRRIRIYAADADYSHLPIAVRDWAVVAATGFRYRARPPANTLLVSPRHGR